MYKKFCVRALLIASGVIAPIATTAGAPIILALTSVDFGPAKIDQKASGLASSESVGDFSLASASAQFGVLRAIGQATQIQGTALSHADAHSAATWLDDVTIDAPGMTGQSGTITVAYRIDSTDFRFNSSATATVNYSFFVTRGQIFDNISRGLNEIGVGANNEPNFLNIPLSATFPIVFGSSRQWQFSISADAEIFGVNPNEIAVADLGDTALWGGVSSVRDAEGNLISSFSVTSASGTDWSQAASEPSSSVPEGPSLALSALGIIALLVTRRRR